MMFQNVHKLLFPLKKQSIDVSPAAVVVVPGTTKGVDGTPMKHWEILESNHQTIVTSKRGIALERWDPNDPDFWKRHLNRQEFQVMRQKGTERPGSSPYDKFYPTSGHFCCRSCGLSLYSPAAKFDSGTGWPSFGSHVQGNVETEWDVSYGVRRTELHCRRCRAHLGHVFAERNRHHPEFRERQCINGVALKYVEADLPEGSHSRARALAHRPSYA